MHKRLALSLLLITAAAAAQLSNQAGNPRPRPDLKPFTMNQVRTETQTFADGLTRTFTQKVRFARDSAGRTRSENEYPGPAPATYLYDRDGKKSSQPGFAGAVTKMVSVSVRDPITGLNWNWTVGDTQRKEARANNVIPAIPTGRRANSPRPQASDNLPVIEVHIEELGTRAIEGVIATGNRTTTKYPAGYDGWSREFTSTQEYWRALDYNVIVESTTDDPRTGKTVLTLTSFTDGEPDPSLFKPPADYYKIVTEMKTEAPADKP